MRRGSPAAAFFFAAVLIVIGVIEAVKLNKLEKVCTEPATGIIYDVEKRGRYTGYKAWVKYEAEGDFRRLYIQSFSQIFAGRRIKVLYDGRVPGTSYSPDYPPRDGILEICIGGALALYGTVFVLYKRRRKTEEDH